MEIVYKKLTETELETFIDMRITQLTEEYENAGKEVPKDVDLKSALFDYYHKHMADGTFVSWLAMDGDRIVGTSGMSFVEVFFPVCIQIPHIGVWESLRNCLIML